MSPTPPASPRLNTWASKPREQCALNTGPCPHAHASEVFYSCFQRKIRAIILANAVGEQNCRVCFRRTPSHTALQGPWFASFSHSYVNRSCGQRKSLLLRLQVLSHQTSRTWFLFPSPWAVSHFYDFPTVQQELFAPPLLNKHWRCKKHVG